MRLRKKDIEEVEFNSGRIIRRPIGRRLWMLAVVVMAVCSVGLAVRAYTRRSWNGVIGMASTISMSRTIAQTSQPLRSLDYTRLAWQPDVDRMRRRLGRRFLSPGRELSVLTGILRLGADARPVRIMRAQEQTGELVSMSSGVGEASLDWSDTAGARNGGRTAAVEDRKLIERIALDSVDQFILSQVRGASYRTVARNVAPRGAADLEDYGGPAWDVIRVAEPESSGDNRPLSGWRLYYVNTVSGLIERVVSQEEGETVEAEVARWVDRNGEKLPMRIVWRRNGEVMMELNLADAMHIPRQ